MLADRVYLLRQKIFLPFLLPNIKLISMLLIKIHSKVVIQYQPIHHFHSKWNINSLANGKYSFQFNFTDHKCNRVRTFYRQRINARKFRLQIWKWNYIDLLILNQFLKMGCNVSVHLDSIFESSSISGPPLISIHSVRKPLADHLALSSCYMESLVHFILIKLFYIHSNLLISHNKYNRI